MPIELALKWLKSLAAFEAGGWYAGPASPVIEALEPVGQHMNVSWKSDVTSRQDSFAVVFVRNDTGERRQEDTRHNWLLLSNLYPGASYQIRVYAVSHGLWSEPHSYYQTVCEFFLFSLPKV